MIDGALNGLQRVLLLMAGEAAAEHHRRSLGDDDNAFADFTAKQISRGGFTAPWSSRENDAATVIVVKACICLR